jgi:hypothetical protein
MEQQVVEMRWESQMDEKKQRGYFQMLLSHTNKAQMDQVLERDSSTSDLEKIVSGRASRGADFELVGHKPKKRSHR